MKHSLATLILLASSLTANAAQTTPQLSQHTGKKIYRATQLQQEERLHEAISVLTSFDPKSAYDSAVVNRLLGIYYWQTDQPDQAISSLSKAVAPEIMTQKDHWHTQRMLADILFAQQAYQQGIDHYLALLRSNFEPSSVQEKTKHQQQLNQLHFRVATGYYQLQHWENVRHHLIQYQAENNEQKLHALRLKVVSELRMSRWKDAEHTLSDLIRIEPDNITWWQQQISTQLQQHKSQAALETYALAKHQKIKFALSDYLTLGQLYAQHNIPERGARILEEMFTALPESRTDANLATQARYWQIARAWPQAIESWQKAATLSPKHSWPLTLILLQQGYYSKALISLEKARPYADKEDITLTHIRILSKLERYNDALAAAKRLNEKRPSKTAQGWINYLELKAARSY